MSDLNDWRLTYPGASLDFGTLSTEYPFSVQVEIGEADLINQDQRHPTSDGMVFGKDSLGGFDLTFNLTTIPEFPLPPKPWVGALDLFSAFKTKWRADPVRLNPGVYAELANLDRGRMVYGRPRKIAPKSTRLRKGLLEYVAVFTTNDPNFYSTTEKAALITPVPPPSGGFTVPLTAPFSTAVGSAELAPTINAGDTDAWPIVSFHGPGKAFSIELLNNTETVWELSVPTQLKFDEVLTVDTRPWSRSATINGRPANGRVRGSQIEKCFIPVGAFTFRFKVSDPSGTAFADAKWRDAFASL